MPMPKNIIISSDHNGIVLKDYLKTFLKSQGYGVVDFGPYEQHGKVDYNFFADLVSKSISNQDVEKGILICGTGVGMSIVANRNMGVRAVLAHNLTTASKSRDHNDSNILCLGSWISTQEEAVDILKHWLNEKWGEGRHGRRVHMIDNHKPGVVLTNGVFDVLHRGHIELLKFSKAQGEKLVVAIDNDKLVKSRKGPSRPVNSSIDRKALLDSLYMVDEVVIFDTPLDLKDLYSKLRPQTLVKGSEWTVEEVRERDQIPEHIEIKVFPIFEELSSTKAIERIKSK